MPTPKPRRRFLPIVLAAGALLLAADVRSSAQSLPAARQFDAANRRPDTPGTPPADDDDEALVEELMAGDMLDLGVQAILSEKPRPRHFAARIDSQLLYTSNMFLEEAATGRTATSVLVNSLQLSWIPPELNLGGRLASRVGVIMQWFNYGLADNTGVLNNFDFDTQTVFGRADLRLDNGWVLGASLHATRLLGHQPDYLSYRDLYSELSPKWSVTRQFFLNEVRYFTLSYQGDYRLSRTPGALHPSLNDRTDHALFIGYDHALTPDLWIAPYYRFQYFRYTRTGKRHEYLQTLGLSFLWRITPAVQVQFLVNHDWRESRDPVQPDYRKLDAGLGINLQARF